MARKERAIVPLLQVQARLNTRLLYYLSRYFAVEIYQASKTFFPSHNLFGIGTGSIDIGCGY
jgi:hypothetical protein